MPVKRNWDGLTVQELIAQSVAIHPDWSVDDHRNYLLEETAFDEYDLAGRSIWLCAFPAGCSEYALHGGQLCTHHQISLNCLFANADGTPVKV